MYDKRQGNELTVESTRLTRFCRNGWHRHCERGVGCNCYCHCDNEPEPPVLPGRGVPAEQEAPRKKSNAQYDVKTIEFCAKDAEKFCLACQKGESVVVPGPSSIVGQAAVHTPSGNICIPNTIRLLKGK